MCEFWLFFLPKKKLNRWIFFPVVFIQHVYKNHTWRLDPYLCPEAAVLPGAEWFQGDRGRNPAGPEPPQGLCSQNIVCLFWFLTLQSPGRDKKKKKMRRSCAEQTPTEEKQRFYCTDGRDIKSLTVSHSPRAQHGTYLAHPPHYMCPLWVGQTEIRAHY